MDGDGVEDFSSDNRIKEKILEALKARPEGVAALAIAKMVNAPLMEVVRVLELLAKGGFVEKKGKIYRLK